jgi:segregation and condensation protein A
MDYLVDLDNFRGPLDLLLYLVKRQEVDVCDIPIAQVTEQFLEYLRILELIDVERAGDFLVMAATLMEIKSKMLLPRADDEAEEAADPRMELVRQLVEYKKFKDAAMLLETQAERQLSRLPRLPVETPIPLDPAQQPLRAVELWDLVSAFGRLMRETLALQPQQIVVDDTPIHVYQARILELVEREPRVAFEDVFAPPRSRSRLVGLFLAMLELIKTRQITAQQDAVFGQVWIHAVPPDSAQVGANENLGPNPP